MGYEAADAIAPDGMEIATQLRSVRSSMKAAYRNGVAMLAAILIVFVSTPASAALKMQWDCYLPTGGLDCVILEGGLTGKIPFLERVSDAREADVVVTLTSLPAESGTRFKLDFTGRTIDGYATEVHTSDKIPDSVDRSAATIRLLTKLQRGLDDFMEQKTAAEVQEGVLTMQLTDPSHPPYAGRPEQRALKWYLAPAASTYFSDVHGVGINASGNASLSLNYSGAKWRAQQWLGASYSRQSQPVPSTGDTASVSFSGADVSNVVSRSISDDNRWNAALLFSTEKNPQANYRMRANGSMGIEYDLIPRQTVNQQNLGARCAIGAEVQRYDAPNIEGETGTATGRQFCDAFLNWHFQPVDIWVSLGESVVLKDVEYRSFTASVSAAWRVTDNITVSPFMAIQQITKALNEAAPSNVEYTDARMEIEASMLAAARQGYTAPFSVQSGLSIRYLFGNGSLSSEDERWKNASNLR